MEVIVWALEWNDTLHTEKEPPEQHMEEGEEGLLCLAS